MCGRRGAKSTAEKETMAEASIDEESAGKGGEEEEEESRDAACGPVLEGLVPSASKPSSALHAFPQRERGPPKSGSTRRTAAAALPEKRYSFLRAWGSACVLSTKHYENPCVANLLCTLRFFCVAK